MRREMNERSWDRFANIYDGFMAKDKAAYEQMYDLIGRSVKGKTVLELATGTGLIAGNIVKSVRQIEATDFSTEMIQKAKEKYRSSKLHFSVQDAKSLPYAEQSFDVVIIANGLHIMAEPEKALSEIRRVLKDDGLLIAPNFVDAQSSLKTRFRLKAMGLAGFKPVSKWSKEEYMTFLRQNHWQIETVQELEAAFPLIYTECRKAV